MNGAYCVFRASRALHFAATLFFLVLVMSGCASVTSSNFAPEGVSIVISPTNVAVKVAATHKFTATVINTQNKTVIWQVNGITGGDSIHGFVDSTGAYVAPPAKPSPSTVTVTAIPSAKPKVSASAQVTITEVSASIAVNLSPSSASVQAGKTQSLTATVQNDSLNEGVKWTLTGAGCTGTSCGTLSSITSTSGAAVIYTAPATVPAPANVTITATSATDSTKSATSAITVTATPSAPINVAVSPATASVPAGKTQSLTAAVQNDSQNKGVTWTVSGAGCNGNACGTLSASSSGSGSAISYTAPSNVPSPATVTITAISMTDTTKSAIATFTVTAAPPPPAISVSVSPATSSVQVGKTQSVTASVQNDSQNKGVTWSVSGAGCSGNACGTLSTTTSASGTAITYTAPSNVPSPATVTITAKSVADTGKTATATLTVTATPPPPTISVTITASSTSVQTGKTQSVTASVQNDSQNKGVTWSLSGTGCSGNACGTLSTATSASGTAITYTAPSNVPSPATVTITAKSVADAGKTATATLTVTGAAPPPSITVSVSPSTASVQTGKTQTFTANVSNDSQNKGVTWSLSGTGCSGNACGTLSATTSASGTAITYTAPSSVPSPAAVTISALSVTDTGKSATAAIAVTAPVVGGNTKVEISPVRAALTTGQQQTFTAKVSGNDDKNVTWEVDGTTGGNSSVGTIDGNGNYHPPSSSGSHTVTARSTGDTTVSASATVYITDLGGVYTYHNNLARDGVNTKEYALNTSNVNGNTFGKQFACAIDGQAYAQPLWVANVSIGGGTHNVIIAATQHDTVYAFDADASPCQTYWSQSLLNPGETWVKGSDIGTEDITPDVGIVGTPVIDSSSKTIYLVSKSKSNGNFHQRLHALNISDGTEKLGGPVEISFSAYGHTFDALRQNQRCGLALVNGVVYIAYASHGDNPTYYGWVVGYSASNLSQVNVYNADPDSGYGGIWMSGGAPASDGSNLYVITGNGKFNGTNEFGDSFLKLSTGNGLSLASWFTPYNESNLSGGDQDVGAGGAAILVDQPSGPVPHLVIGGGKEGLLYLLNRDNLGGFNANDNSGSVQTFSVNNGIYATPAFWQNTLYLAPTTDHLKAYSFNTGSGTFDKNSSSQSPGSFGFPGATPVISSQGSSNGIVWAIERSGSGVAVLHAYDATNVGNELWNSGTGKDKAGQPVKFAVPTVANGKVYVGTGGEISVYGLSPN